MHLLVSILFRDCVYFVHVLDFVFYLVVQKSIILSAIISFFIDFEPSESESEEEVPPPVVPKV